MLTDYSGAGRNRNDPARRRGTCDEPVNDMFIGPGIDAHDPLDIGERGSRQFGNAPEHTRIEIHQIDRAPRAAQTFQCRRNVGADGEVAAVLVQPRLRRQLATTQAQDCIATGEVSGGECGAESTAMTGDEYLHVEVAVTIEDRRFYAGQAMTRQSMTATASHTSAPMR